MTNSKSAMVSRPAAISCRVPQHALLGTVAALLLAGVAEPVFAAASCRFSTVTPVNFGVYNVFNTLPDNDGVGSIRVVCSGGGGPFVVTLSSGQSSSYASRVMRSGANTLNYNLYTAAARTLVWGNGTGGSGTMTWTKNSTTTLSVYGQIPAGQDVPVGVYTDNITAIVNF